MESTPRKSEAKVNTTQADVVVIAALKEELDAFLTTLGRSRRLDKGPTDVHTYYTATVRTHRRDRSSYQVVVTSLLSMGPLNASAQAVAVVNRWKPRYVLLVGIACGVRGVAHHGDILIASQVADYTLGKQSGGPRQVRWHVFPCGASLLDSANNVGADWAKAITEPRPKPGEVERHTGVIASGGDVISDDQVVATYSESWPKLVGIEMESGGLAAGLHQTPDPPQFLMIKSVSDFGKDKHDPDVKPWRRYACHAAAAFALSIIKSGPSRSFGYLTKAERSAVAEDDSRQVAERQWQYIQSHPIRAIGVLFMLKGTVGLSWFREVLSETRLTFSWDIDSFNFGQIIAAAPAPNTKERPHPPNQPVCSFWKIYEPEAGYWVKKIKPVSQEFSVVAGFDGVAPWSMLGIQEVGRLADLALLTEIGVSLPSRAFQVGVEELILTFVGDTFSFSVELSDHGLEALHQFASMQYAVTQRDKPMPLGIAFSGVQLLDMFLRDLLPRPKNGKPKRPFGLMGLSGPDGNAISFYPTMPVSFNKSAESEEYTFTLTVPEKLDLAAKINKLKKQLQKKPEFTQPYAELAELYLREGRLSETIQCLTQGIRLAPACADMHGMMAQALGMLGRAEEALPHCERAVALAPEKVRARTVLGTCLSELGRYDEALAQFEAAVRIESDNAICHLHLGRGLVRLGRIPEAIAALERSVELDSQHADSVKMLGALLDGAGRAQEGVRHLEQATKLAPEDADAHQWLGQHYARAKNWEAAAACFQRAIEIEADARRCELLAGALGQLRRWPDAEVALRRAVKLMPDNVGMRVNLAAAVANMGRLAEALELLEESLRINPKNAAAQRIRARIRKEET